MAYENKPGFGALFKNDKAEGKQPQYRGNFKDPDGNSWEIAAWVKEGAKGKFFSLKVSPPYKRDEQKQETSNEPFDDSAIPF